MSAGPYLPPASSEKFDRLKDILRTMFQLDRGDLDFGLYRIMNLKAAEIMAFLDNDLLPQVRDVLNLTSDEERARLEKALQTAQKQARGLGIDPDTTPKVSELKQQLAEAKADAAAETDVYNHLANFFARYYDEGDFMSLRRYSGGGQSSYLIPYNGEEVKLHWANADQYYIKSTENYASYVFTVGAEKRRVRFEIAKADNEKDNVKEASGKQRRFVLAESETAQPALSVLRLRPSGATLSTNGPPDLPERSTVEGAVETDNSELVVRFEHRPLTEAEKRTYPGNNSKQQDRLNEATAKRILEALEPDWLALLATLAPTESNPDRTVLDKHLATYTARNSFDYFIHKDLGGFLRRELDLYLKNDVLNVDDLEAGDAARLHRALARMRATRHVADKIIIFLAQIEDFQKQLWLKKKFALETQYCVTLDRVPDGLYAEIVTNEAQHDEWVKLFAIDEIEGDLANGNTGYTNPLTVEFLKTNPYLALDTRHFDRDFTDRLLAALSEAGPLDEQLDGLLVHSENFQALNLLQARYREQVKCVYIDPPYNTGDDGFLYKDRYEDSSWLSLMTDRLALAYALLDRAAGSHSISIDDREFHALLSLLQDTELGRAIKTITVKMAEPTGVKMAHVTHSGGIPKLKEYIVLTKPTGIQGFQLEKVPKDKWDNEYNLVVTGISRDEIRRLKSIIEDEAREDPDVRVADEICQRISLQSVQEVLAENRISRSEALPWKYANAWRIVRTVATTNSVKALADEKRAAFSTNCFTVVTPRQQMHIIKAEYAEEADQPRIRLLFADDYLTVHPGDFWQDIKTTGLDNEGGVELISGKKPEKLIRRIIGMASSPGELVCDYFLGSGTSVAVAQKMNRKWLGVESSNFFDALPLTRMKLVLFGEKGGVSDVEGWKGGGFFQYIHLESYEDTLDSLEVRPPSTDQQALLSEQPTLAEDYWLRYALGEETAESACLLGKHFTDPFAYTLSVVRDGVRQEVPVDLPETFNYLIGLRVESRQRRDGVLTIIGMDAEGKRCLILWRNLDEMDNPTLEAWFLRYRPTFGALDLIYVNGDHTLNALKDQTESWTAQTTEPVFRALTFEEEEYGR